MKGVIAHDHDTKLLGEDGEGVTIGCGTRHSPKAKPFEENPRDTLTCGWGNRPNPEKDPTSAYGWGNRPNPKKNPTGIEVQGRHNNRLGKRKKVRSTLIPPRQSQPMEHQGDPQERSHTSINVGGGMGQERCIPIPRRTRIKPEVVGTRRTDISMVVGVRQMGNRPMAACTQYLGHDLDTKAIHPSQRKMTKRQQTRITLMASGTRHADFGPRVESSFYLKRVRQMGKSLLIASTQQTDFDMMAVLQRTKIPRVVAEQ